MKNNSSNISLFIKAFLLAFLFFGTVFLIQLHFDFFKVLKLKLSDLNHKFSYHVLHTKPVKGREAVLILLDPKTDRKFKYRYPFPRNIMAEMVNKISSQNPKLFAMDFTFIGSSKVENEDHVLSNSLKSKKIILFTFVHNDGKVFKIPEIFSKAAQDVGIITKKLDPDNRIRSIAPFHFDIESYKNYYCAELLLALNYYNLPTKILDQDVINNKLIFKIPNSPLKDIYYGDWTNPGIYFKNYYTLKDLKTLSFIDVYNGKVPKDIFKDKVVLMGRQSEIYHDRHVTPLGMQLGVVVVYNSFLTFLNNEFLEPLPIGIDILSYFLIIFLYIYLMLMSKKGINSIITISFLTTSLITGYILFENNLIWDSWIPFSSIFLFYLSKQIFDFIYIWKANEKIKNSIIYDSKTGLMTFPYFLSKLKTELICLRNDKNPLFIAAFRISSITQSLINEKPELNNLIIKAGEFIAKILKRHEYFTWDKNSLLFYLVLKKTSTANLRNKINQKLLSTLESLSLSHEFISSLSYCNVVELNNPLIHPILASLKQILDSEQFSDNYIVKLSPNDYSSTIEANPEHQEVEKTVSDEEFVSREIKSFQNHLSELENKIKLSSQEIEISRKLSSVGKIAAEVAHELKNPLQNLLYMSEFLSRYIDKEHKAFKYTEILKKETDRMAKLCHQMLDFSKIKPTENKEININALINETLSFMTGTFRKKHVNLVTTIDESIPSISAQEDKLKQVFLNLFINAVDAMNDPGELYVETLQQAGIVQINIKDNGMGIPQENLDKIFDLFYTTKGSKGTGLGLSTCFNIIKNHGGKISVQSEIGSGTTFTIILPL